MIPLAPINLLLSQLIKISGSVPALTTLAGQTWVFELKHIGSIAAAFEMDSMQLVDAECVQADGKIKGRLEDFIALLKADDINKALQESDIEIQGSTKYLFALQDLAKQLLPDPAYLLSQKLGDVPASIIMHWLSFNKELATSLGKQFMRQFEHFQQHEADLAAENINKVFGELSLIKQAFFK